MSDEPQNDEPQNDEAVSEGAGQGSAPHEPTGNDTVDRVLASLDGLDDRPVDEHVAVFESAQEQLRDALESADPGEQDTARSHS